MNYFDKIMESVLAYLPRIGTSLILCVAGLWIIRLIRKGIKKILMRSKLDPAAHKLILQVLDILLKTILILMVLGNLGVDTTSVITLIGAAGLAASLALQNSLSNFAGGILILLSHPFHKGDFIESNGVSGTVQAITLWNTKLSTVDNKAVFIPNGELSAAKITNYSMEDRRRLDIVVPIGYNDDVRFAKDCLVKIIDEMDLVLKDPEPIIGVANFGSSAVEMALKVWVKTDSYWDLHYKLLERIKIVFDEEGITIPYQQMDVYLKGVENREKNH